MRHKHFVSVKDSKTNKDEAAGIEPKAKRNMKEAERTKWSLSVCVNSETAHRPTVINIHHVEKGQRQRWLPAASATTDPHLTEEEERWSVSFFPLDAAVRQKTPVWQNRVAATRCVWMITECQFTVLLKHVAVNWKKQSTLGQIHSHLVSLGHSRQHLQIWLWISVATKVWMMLFWCSWFYS